MVAPNTPFLCLFLSKMEGALVVLTQMMSLKLREDVVHHKKNRPCADFLF
ncbi:hypothetical protein LX69_00530 [Breznakibacter xylanolyticus]|uniref:Uncharacterized protein n=1 Tax=Breznakibacter xylanolyticus TaxID=990 RepID=A0A2W7NIL4_9BACT|nr:hypothetical protein LX69_00530 [Breznakibacter xylanolyticus]